ncbi:MAG: type II secretion system F family protein, partial [Planctomycetaceae bacterium]|nr:type II secretion system F family protein [Planctomycetaceae bacterium]
ILIPAAVFVGVTAFVIAAFSLFTDFSDRGLETRLQILTGKKTAAEASQVTKDVLLREGVSGLSALTDKIMEKFSNLKLLFVQADSPISPSKFFGITLACAAVGLVVATIGRAPLPMYPFCAMLFALLPLGWLLWRRRCRFKKFAMQLPDALELVARALRSGHSLASGLSVVVQEMPDPISKEFGMAYEEQNLGIPIEAALKNLHKRMPNMDFKFFATAVAIQRQSGGDLAEILDKIGHIVRGRFRILGQVAALTGEGRISGVVLMALPIALFFAVYYLNQEYVMLLFTDELGRKMVALAAVLQVLGAITIKKIVAIKV